MRKSGVFFLFIFAVIFTLGFAIVQISMRNRVSMQHLQTNIEIVKRLSLSDLCLFTEANYTRHLSQGDLYAPFQDGPMTLEHFPSGSLVPPPAFNRK